MIQRIYLSSTSYARKPHSDWKKRFISNFNSYAQKSDFSDVVTFIDPLLFDTYNPEVVEMDLENIQSSSVIVFYIQKPSIGTIMELSFCTMCYSATSSLYIISGNDSVINHPWIQNLAVGSNFRRVTLCTSVKQAVKTIIDDLRSKHENQ